jgi:hypothetical protein
LPERSRRFHQVERLDKALALRGHRSALTDALFPFDDEALMSVTQIVKTSLHIQRVQRT